MDALLLERVLERSGSTFLMQRVPDGEQAIAYLEGTGAFRDRTRHPLPDVLLLDLKMPRKDGFDVLRWRQQVTTAKFVPVVVFSSSNLPEDVQRAYSLGANSYVAKPSGPQRLDRFVRSLQEWWADLNLTALTPL